MAGWRRLRHILKSGKHLPVVQDLSKLRQKFIISKTKGSNSEMGGHMDLKSQQRLRDIAHIKFKRKAKCLQEQIDQKGTSETLQMCFVELNKAYEQLEQAHELLENNPNIKLEIEELFMDGADSLKISITSAYYNALAKSNYNQDTIADKPVNELENEKSVNVNSFKIRVASAYDNALTILNDNQDTVADNINIKVKSINPSNLDGDIKEHPTSKRDYECIKGQATQLDFHQTMENFKIMFPNVNADVIEAVLRANQGDINKTSDQLLTMDTDTYSQELIQQFILHVDKVKECSVCCEVYDEGNHMPLVLPCGHTLCKGCVNNISELQCPICRQTHNVNKNDLPTNYQLLDLLRTTENTQKANELVEAGSNSSNSDGNKYTTKQIMTRVAIGVGAVTTGAAAVVAAPAVLAGLGFTSAAAASGGGLLSSFGLGMGALAGGTVAVVAAPFALAGAGFTSAGIAAGSWAASMMSGAAVANGGAVAAGSLVAILQSAGVVGFGASAVAGVGAAGAAVGAAATGIATGIGLTGVAAGTTAAVGLSATATAGVAVAGTAVGAAAGTGIAAGISKLSERKTENTNTDINECVADNNLKKEDKDDQNEMKEEDFVNGRNLKKL